MCKITGKCGSRIGQKYWKIGSLTIDEKYESLFCLKAIEYRRYHDASACMTFENSSLKIAQIMADHGLERVLLLKYSGYRVILSD